MKTTASRPRAARFATRPLACAVAAALCCMSAGAWAQTAAPSRSATLPEVKVTDTPDGSTEGTYTAPSISI